MSNVVITSAGLDYVLSASSNDITIKIAYFVPVYDYRIDGTIQEASTTSAFSAIADESLDEPVGEILWNVSSTNYTQSDSSNFIISASSYGAGGTYTSPFQTQSNTVNLLNGNTLSPHLSGSSVYISAAPYGWGGIEGTSVGNNDRPTDSDSDFFSVTDYYPVRTSAGSDELRGNFRCVLNKDVGQIRFNKVALYAVAVDNSGDVISGSQKFFAEAYLNEPITKAGLAIDGFDSLVMDFQIDLHSISADWSDVFFGTSGDYWATTVNGLHSSQKISIGVFDSEQTPNAEPQATVHAGQPNDSDGDYERIPQVRMDYPNNDPNAQKTFTQELKGDGKLYISATDQDFTILPLVSACRLGDLTYPFDRLTFAGGTSSAPDGTIRIRSSDSDIADYGPYFQLYKQFISVYDDPDKVDSVLYNTIYGYDIVRNNSDLMLQTRFQDIYIVAGSKNNAGPPTSTGGDSHKDRHENVITNIGAYEDYNNPTTATSAISESDNWLFNHTYIVAREGIRTFGPLEVNYIPRDWTGFRSEYTSASSVVSTQRKYMSLVAGFRKFDTYTGETDQYARYEGYLYANAVGSEQSDSTAGSNFDPFTQPTDHGYVSSGSKLFIAAGQIRTYGDIKPGYNEKWKLGDYEKKWKEMHTRFLNVGTTDSDADNDPSGDRISSNIYGAQIEQKFVEDDSAEGQYRETLIYPATSRARGDVSDEILKIGYGGNPVGDIVTEDLTVTDTGNIDSLLVDNISCINDASFGRNVYIQSNRYLYFKNSRIRGYYVENSGEAIVRDTQHGVSIDFSWFDNSNFSLSEILEGSISYNNYCYYINAVATFDDNKHGIYTYYIQAPLKYKSGPNVTGDEKNQKYFVYADVGDAGDFKMYLGFTYFSPSSINEFKLSVYQDTNGNVQFGYDGADKTEFDSDANFIVTGNLIGVKNIWG